MKEIDNLGPPFGDDPESRQEALRCSHTAQLVEKDASRCAVCGWPLAKSWSDGCVRGSCSMRPRPERLYDPERADKELKQVTGDAAQPQPSKASPHSIDHWEPTLKDIRARANSSIVREHASKALEALTGCTSPLGERSESQAFSDSGYRGSKYKPEWEKSSDQPPSLAKATDGEQGWTEGVADDALAKVKP